MKKLLFFCLILVIKCILSNDDKANLKEPSINTKGHNWDQILEESKLKFVLSDRNRFVNYSHSVVCAFFLTSMCGLSETTFVLTIYYTSKIGAILTLLSVSTVIICLNLVWIFAGSAVNLVFNEMTVHWFTFSILLITAFYLFFEGLRMRSKLMIEDLMDLEDEKKRFYELQILEMDQSERLLIGKDNENFDNSEIKRKGKFIQESDKKSFKTSMFCDLIKSLFIESFGGRSQITVLALAGSFDLWGVIIGSSLSHAIIILISVTLGRWFSEKISDKFVTLTTCLLFSIYSIDLLQRLITPKSLF